MSRIRTAAALVAAGVLTMLILLPASPARAHEGREVGDVVMLVGFGSEPAVAYEPNWVSLTLTDHDSEQPILNGVDLEVEISYGEESTTMAMEPAFGDTGEYRAVFVPSRPGDYAFRFVGPVRNQDIDEEFTSGPDTFSPANDPAEISFPAQDPTVAEVADRLEQETTRLSESITQLEQSIADEGTTEEEDPAAEARTLAMIALIVGAVALVAGLAIGGLALRRARA